MEDVAFFKVVILHRKQFAEAWVIMGITPGFDFDRDDFPVVGDDEVEFAELPLLEIIKRVFDEI